MSDLDVSLRLKLINLMSAGAREAVGDLKSVQAAADAVEKNSASSAKATAGELKQTVDGAKKVAAALGQVESAVERVAEAHVAGAKAAASDETQAVDAAKKTVTGLNQVENAVERINQARAASAKMPVSVWVEEQKRIKEAQAAADHYFSNIEKKLAHLGQASMAFNELSRLGANLGKPIDEATDAAVEFEKRIASITKAGGLLGAEKDIGESILAAAKAGVIRWEELAKGERQLVALGGGDYLNEIAPVRARLAQLIKASEADAGDLYNLMYHYMHLLKMSPQDALSASQVNYQQGKKGAFELKDLAEVMPRLIPLGQEYMTNKQVATDLVALLQILRKQTGSASEAETRARHLMTKLSDPAEAKKIEKDLDLDIYQIRKDAAAKGEDQLFAVLDAIAAKFKAMGDAAGHVKDSPEGPDHEGTVEGADPKKLGGIARDYYFRAGLEAYMKMRAEIKDYLPGQDEAAKATAADFAATTKTAAAALERLTIATDEARIRAGDTQLPIAKAAADAKAKAAELGGDLAKAAPGATGVALTASNAVAKLAEGIGNLGSAAIAGATAVLSLRWLLGKIRGVPGEGAPGAGAGEGAPAGEAKPAAPEPLKPGITPEEHAAAVETGTMIGRALLFYGAVFDQAIHGVRKLDGEYLQSHGVTPEMLKRLNAETAARNAAAAAPQPSAPAPAASAAGGAAGAEAGKAIADAAQKGAQSADLAPAAQATMQKYAASLQGAGAPAIAAVEAIVAQIKALLDIHATPTIQPRLLPPTGAATPSSSAAPATPARQKQASAAGGSVHIAQANFYGVNDPKKLHQQVMAQANRDAAATHAGALHDIDTGGVG